jgi:hypothetical protein
MAKIRGRRQAGLRKRGARIFGVQALYASDQEVSRKTAMPPMSYATDSDAADVLRSLFCDACERGIKYRIALGRRRDAEIGDINVFDLDIRLEPLAVDRFT